MFKIRLTIAAFGLSLGLVGYQAIAVRQRPARIPAGESLRLDEVKRLGDSLMPAPQELELPLPAAETHGGLPLARHGGFVTAPDSAGRAKAVARVRGTASEGKSGASKAASSGSKESAFKKRSDSPISRALNEKFYSAASFGFSPRIKATHAGRAVMRTRTNGHN